jgi:hypothetical protein
MLMLRQLCVSAVAPGGAVAIVHIVPEGPNKKNHASAIPKASAAIERARARRIPRR